nr:glycosyltransferase [uncultured Halomonas sp.]
MTAIWHKLRRLFAPGVGSYKHDIRRLVEQSGFFDPAWYCQQPGIAGKPFIKQSFIKQPADQKAAVAHYLEAGAALGLNPGPGFDGAWYLAAYPDVAEAEINPLVHYLLHGRAEGRLPRCNRALAWEHHLWRGAEAVMVPRLQGLLERLDATDEEQGHAAWALARWWAWQADWPAVVDCLLPAGRLRALPDHPGPGLLAVNALCQIVLSSTVSSSIGETQHRALLHHVLAELERRFPEHSDTQLARINALALEQGRDAERLEGINQVFRQHGLQGIARRDASQPLTLDNLGAITSSLTTSSLTTSSLTTSSLTTSSPLPLAADASPIASHGKPLVSVIIPLYNAAGTISTALQSLFAQTWPALEILVVDDASTDGSLAVVKRLAAECPAGVALHVLTHSENRGAYAARNTGLAMAQGKLVTTHDSDDWPHPEKIERQVRALNNAPKAMACLSHWVRATPALHFHRWRVEPEGWTYRNISSLMFRHEVFKRLGYWDEVKVNGDTEYHERLLAAYGTHAVIDVLPGVPLALGRAGSGSLSQHSETHLVTQFVGVRHDYMASARRWHRSASLPESLYLPRQPGYRPFAAPAAICRGALPVRFVHSLDALQGSKWLDAGWYLRHHIDLQGSLIEPVEHYWAKGAAENRDPGPYFSTSGYRYQYDDVAEQGINPLLHYLSVGVQQGREPWPVFAGKKKRRPGRPTVMLCAHQAKATLYGAERSLLDIVQALDCLAFNCLVTLPSAENQDYLEKLREKALAVAVLPYGWWQQGKRPEPLTVGYFQALMRRFSVDLVHANTLVLDEPLQAARPLGIPALVHVRELPAHDAALCATLGASAPVILRRAVEAADGIIANSHCVASHFNALANMPANTAEKLAVVPNTIDMAPLLALPPKSRDNDAAANNAANNALNSAVTVGMLSSNLPKKGLADLEAMAEHLQMLAPKVRIAIYGPETPALQSLLQRRRQGAAPATLDYRGYVSSPAQALADIDILVNLSRFQESFGRTVLEAMAAARPVVCYDWGALPELVMEGCSGYLVPFGDAEAAARRVAQLAHSASLRHAMGEAGRARAVGSFGADAFASALLAVYQRAMPGTTRQACRRQT